jgi:uncharacterized phiE125 gp8 family phage protein
MIGFGNRPVHQSTKVISQPEQEPISLEQAKAHLRIIDFNGDDDLISALIIAAREWVENYTQRALITQTIRFQLDSLPWFGNYRPLGAMLYLPMPRVQVVNSIKYLDGSGTQHTLDESRYVVDTDSEPCRVVSQQHQPFPFTARLPGAISIEYVAGYGDNGSDVPYGLKQAMLLLVGHWYRATSSVGDFGTEAPMGVYSLCAVHCWGGI